MAADPKLSLKPVDEPDTLLTALLAVQKELPRISLQKTGKNPAFKSSYLTLDGLHAALLPLLSRHGLVWTTLPAISTEGPILVYKLLHVTSGEGISGEMPLMLDKQNSQGLGSAITYARRYSLLSVIGAVGDEDDDGNKASASEVTKEVKRKEAKPLDAAALAQLEKAVKDAGKDIEMAARAVKRASKHELTEADGWEILAKLPKPVSAK